MTNVKKKDIGDENYSDIEDKDESGYSNGLYLEIEDDCYGSDAETVIAPYNK